MRIRFSQIVFASSKHREKIKEGNNMKEAGSFYIRGNIFLIDLISSSQLATMKHFECHSGAQLLIILSASVTAVVVSS